MTAGIGGLSAHAQKPESNDRDAQIKELEKRIVALEDALKKLKEREILPLPKDQQHDNQIPSGWINAMQWRCIGPATMGGRITSIAVYEADPTNYWIATASGGLLRTINNGVTFEHQFDKETSVSIGSVAVAPTDKNIVWVGSGEGNPRNSVSCGDGVYKSGDGGKTWKNMGLKDSYQIGKIVVHPKIADVVYVAVLGRLYGPNQERGLFKTVDGGKSWNKVFFVDDKTGVIDVVMHPTDPETLLVATWERQRDEFDSFRGDSKKPEGADEYAPAKVHAPGSGIYRSTDGGKTFGKLTKGLPKARLGRIGLNFAQKTPDTVFAIIDTEKAGSGNSPPAQPNVGYLGVTGEDDKQGAKLTAITEESPAEKAGLKVNDIITHFETKVVKDYESMVGDLRKKKPNDKVKMTLLRGKEKMEVEITLGVRRGPEGRANRPNLGIQFEGTEGGILITEIMPKGPADKAGLKPDDIITQIDAVAITDVRMLRQATFGRKVGDKLKIVYLRGKDKKDVELTLDIVTSSSAGRPNGNSQLGGQVANAQDWQGPEGVDTGGIFKSTDRGETWTRVNSLNDRPFYFSVIRIDPTDDNTIYSLGVDLRRSIDGGKKFSTDGINGGLHSDQHDLWINPKNSRHMIIGTDGGFYVTYDKAAHWEHLNRLALGQFYHVAVDNRRPYHVYGGLQDNGSWGGPSNSTRGIGPINEDWVFVNGGDGFICRVDANDPNIVYAESQDGMMMRRNLRTGASKFTRPLSMPGLGKYRFNWNTPFILSHHNSQIVYSAGNYVFRSVKQGEECKVVSPEITRTKRGSGTALAESPRNADILWVGTDDGALQVTRDGGKTWDNVAKNIDTAALPGPRWVSSIEASRWESGRAYVVFDGHRSDDDAAYVFVTEDYGKTWKSLRGNLPKGPTRVLREDLYVKDLLYLGTEFAAWASIDRGETWTKLNGNTLPTVAIHDFAQPTTANELVVATHGRSIWVLDISALRQLTPAIVKSTAPKLLKPSAAVRWQTQPGGLGPFSESARRFVGQNPIRGAIIDYVLPQKASRVALKIVDVSGKTISELKATTESGLHRNIWNMQTVNLPRPKGVSEDDVLSNPFAQALFGATAGTGTYRVILTVDGQEQATTLLIEPDPNAPQAAMGARDEVEEARALRRLEKRPQPKGDD